MAKIRVLLADDHAVLRAGLKLLINAQADLDVVGEATNAQEALLRARELQPDVLSLDLTMPGGGELRLIEQLREPCPATRVLVLTMHDDPAYLRVALAAGAYGYVVKTAADLELLAALRAVAEGRTFVDLESSSGRVAAGEWRGAAAAGGILSSRESEVLAYVAQGHTNQAIADRLALSVKTIETYRARLLEKLGLRTRADLIRYALESGLLRPGKESVPPAIL